LVDDLQLSRFGKIQANGAVRLLPGDRSDLADAFLDGAGASERLGSFRRGREFVRRRL